MKDYEKQIEKAAYKYSHSRLNNAYYNFLEGAKSPEAKACHQQGMYSEEEVKALIWESRNFFHEMMKYPWTHTRTAFRNWFEQNKKMEAIQEEPELVKVYDNLGGHSGGHWEPKDSVCSMGSY